MMKSDLDICVCNPVTEDYTTFEILVQTENPAFTLKQSRSRRRFSDFIWLKKKLKKHHPMCVCPELPEKKKFADRFDMQFLVQRMKELEDWLLSVTAVTLYLSDTTLHLFLQSSLSCKQIEQYMAGRLSEEQIQQAYSDAKLNNDRIFKQPTTESDSGSDLASNSVEAGATSAPLPISNQEPASLHDNQLRSDSGIAGSESDDDTSCDSDGSPYGSSLDSDKYPHVTLVTDESSKNKEVSKSDTSGTSVKNQNNSDKKWTDETRKHSDHDTRQLDEKLDNLASSMESSVGDSVDGSSAEDKKVTHKVEMGYISSL